MILAKGLVGKNLQARGGPGNFFNGETAHDARYEKTIVTMGTRTMSARGFLVRPEMFWSKGSFCHHVSVLEAFIIAAWELYPARGS